MLETPLGDYRLSPAYDLLNSCIHTKDQDFALAEGLLPKKLTQGKIRHQFSVLAANAGIKEKIFSDMVSLMLSKSDLVEKLTFSSFLDETTKRSYFQSYQRRIKQLTKD